MRREMRARRRLGANSRSTDVVVTPWADEYVPAPCADLPTYPPCHAGAGGRTYLPTPPLISEVGLPTMKKHKTLAPAAMVMKLLVLVFLLPAMMAGEYDNCGRPDAVYATWDQVTRPLRAHYHAPPRSAPNAHCRPCRVDRRTAILTLTPLLRAALTSTCWAARALRPQTHRSLSVLVTDPRLLVVAGLATCPWPPCTNPARTRTTTGPSPRTIRSPR